jgi:U3 small nucleolar RNA-associated protein 20
MRSSLLARRTPALPPPPQVEVDVFRRAQRVRTQPLAGSDSWTHEALQQWRELCSASDWLDAAAEINQLVQTMPQLVHHKDQVRAVTLYA